MISSESSLSIVLCTKLRTGGFESKCPRGTAGGGTVQGGSSPKSGFSWDRYAIVMVGGWQAGRGCEVTVSGALRFPQPTHIGIIRVIQSQQHYLT